MSKIEEDFKKIASIIAIIIACFIAIYVMRYFVFICKKQKRIHIITNDSNHINNRNIKLINVLPV